VAGVLERAREGHERLDVARPAVGGHQDAHVVRDAEGGDAFPGRACRRATVALASVGPEIEGQVV
jgi:hypothetical protein